MEISFEEYPEMAEFYDKMKEVVVYVKCNHVVNEEERGSEERRVMSLGSGVIMNAQGYVMTAAHVIQENSPEISLLLSSGDSIEAEVVNVERKWDLALLKPKERFRERVFNFAMFGTYQEITVGSKVVSLCHSNDLSYKVPVGYVAYPANYDQDSRTVRDLVKSCQSCKTPFKTPVQRLAFPPDNDQNFRSLHEANNEISDPLDKSLKVIQTANLMTEPCASGGPLFNGKGRVIGILAFQVANFDFAVRVDAVKEFYQNSISKEREEMRRENQD